MKYMSELREFLIFPPNQLKLDNFGIQDSCSQRSKDRLANYANDLSGKWLEILKKSSCQKLVCEKSKFCKIQGMSKGSKLHAAWYVARLYKISYVEEVESPFDLQCRF